VVHARPSQRKGLTHMFDTWPLWARDLGIALLATILAWVGHDLVPIMRGQGGAWALAGSLLAMLVTTLTPWLTRGYGVGKRPAPDIVSGAVSDSGATEEA
jgi:hypothetical protein